MNASRQAHIPLPLFQQTSLFRVASTVALCFAMLFASTVDAAPPAGKGNKGGGGNTGAGGGYQPEQHVLWRVQLNAPYSQVRPVLGADGTIYAVDVYDTLTAVSPSGNVLWRAPGAGSKGVDVGPDGTIYTGNEDWIKAFNPDGSLKWTFVQTPRALVTQDIAVGPDGHVYVIASSGLGVFSLADEPGGPRVRWATPESYSHLFDGYAELAFGPTSDFADQQLYFQANGHTRAIRLSDGASVFTQGAEGFANLIVSQADGSWHRPGRSFSPDGDLIWRFEFPNVAIGTSQMSLATDGTHYVIHGGQTMFAIAPDGIEERHFALDEWSASVEVNPPESQLILETQATSTHPVALKSVSATGASLWRMEFPPADIGATQFLDSPIAFSADGRIAYMTTALATTNQTYLYAVNTDPSLPNASTRLRVVDIAMSSRSKRNQTTVSGSVSFLDENKAPVGGALVVATWTLPDGNTVQQTATASGSGTVKFSIVGNTGLYKLSIDDAQLAPYTFDPLRSLLNASLYAN